MGRQPNDDGLLFNEHNGEHAAGLRVEIPNIFLGWIAANFVSSYICLCYLSCLGGRTCLHNEFNTDIIEWNRVSDLGSYLKFVHFDCVLIVLRGDRFVALCAHSRLRSGT